jgi:zinc protease
MLFKGTTTRSGVELDHLIQDAGGYFNAYTSFDRTVYHVTTPSSGTKIALDVLSDIALNATLPEDELTTELDVIRREMEMGNDDPSRKSSRRLFETAYTRSPYRHTVIGYRDIFDELDREAIKSYYHTRYAPNNCFFVVVGDVNADEVLSVLNEKYASHPMLPLPPVLIPPEPRQLASRVRFEGGPFQQAHFHYAWHVPDIRHEDIPALDVLSVILGGGKSSRLYREVRDQQALVHGIDAWTFASAHSGLFGMSARADYEQLGQAREAMLSQVDLCRECLAKPDELTKAIKQFTAGNLATLRTMQGLAGDLGSNWLYTNDLYFSWKHLEALQNTTPDQLQEVACRYFTEANRSLYALAPEGSLKKRPLSTNTKTVDETKKTILPNGLCLLFRRDASLPFVHFRAGIKSGLLVETKKNNGTTRLMSKSMLKGTQRSSSEEIANAIESAGGHVDTFSGNNSHGVSLDIMSEDYALGQETLLDLLLSPAFEKREVDRERKSQLAAIATQRDHLLYHTLKQGRAQLYGESGYGLDPLGSKNLVEAFSPAQLTAHHQLLTAPGNTVIAIHGDIDPDEVEENLLHATSDWEAPPPEISLPDFMRLDEPSRKVTKTKKEQSVVTLSYLGATLGQADQTVLDVISEALNDMGARLFLRIREELGLAYYVGTQNFSGLIPGCFSFYAGTSPDSAVQVEAELIEQAKRLARDGLTAEELNRAKAKLFGHKKIARQELGQVAFSACMDELLGLGFNHSIEEEARVERVTLDDVKEVANRYFATDKHVVALSTPLS